MQTIIQTLVDRNNVLISELNQANAVVNSLNSQLTVAQAEIQDLNVEMGLIAAYIAANPQ